ADMLIEAAGVPFDSIYLAEARKNNIPIEMDASLFTKFTKAKIIGITGTRGKSTVTKMIYHGLKKYYKKGNVFLGGNIRGLATLPLLEKLPHSAKATRGQDNNIIVLELDSWQLQGFGESKISPHIAVFTTFMNDHMNYYKNDMQRYFDDKAEIFKYQTENDFLIISEQAMVQIKKKTQYGKIKSKITVVNEDAIRNFKTKLIGEHNKTNIALAVEVLKLIKLNQKQIKQAIATYPGEPGRLQMISKKSGITYYNDSNATTPDACIAALNSLNENKKNIILICGGANKELNFNDMLEVIVNTTKNVVFIKGTATDKILSILPKDFPEHIVVDSMQSAVKEARKFSKKGDIILLSPGAASFGVFKNEYDRSDQFLKYVKK
ncbi:MAG: UDP-N-acetylmuramoyl-L-alanine--D-glutamate ligase, partial [Candidatus Portnoybacteria bacterium]|nr:UDP-N-acetylmuramoyl-L-alanine--D-glutamate ligase [Candidatus Portnoybacteria bacterium]